MSQAVLAIMAGLLCALAGAKYAASLKSEAARLSRWVQVLRHLSLLLREGILSIPEALCAASDRQHPPDKLLREMAARLTAFPLLPLSDAFVKCSSNCPEKDVLARFFARLGHGSKDSRVLAAEQCADEMRLLAEAASARAEKDTRLWQTLGVIGGTCLTILLL